MSAKQKVHSTHLCSVYARDVVRFKVSPHQDICIFLLYLICCVDKKNIGSSCYILSLFFLLLNNVATEIQ
jgi:hypothetical protein